jgi:hypothetical protein
MFIIGQNTSGTLTLTPIGNEQINLYAGGMYHIGCSSSPDPVWLESINDQWATFYRYPYSDGKRQREQVKIFRHLAHKGTTTKLAALKRYAATERPEHRPDWLDKQIASYEAVLRGDQGETCDRDDIKMVKITFTYTGEGDGWSIFEREYAHSVSGSCDRNGRTEYESYDFSKSQAAELCHRMNCDQMPGFAWVRSEDRNDD